MSHFSHLIHRPMRTLDPAFLHDERLFLDRGRNALAVMERHREHVVYEIETAKALAHAAHIPYEQVLTEEERVMLAVIGVGNQMRRDDAAGLEVARRLRLAKPPGVSVLEQEGEPAGLIDAWAGTDEALVIDGVSSGAAPGTLHRFEAHEGPLPADLFRPSTHALGVADAVELARELGRLPRRRLAVYGIEGESFDTGEGLTEPVKEAVETLVMELYRELEGRH